MTILFFRTRSQRRQRIPRRVRRDLPPRLMRDIGLEPWPQRHRLPLFHFW